VIDQLGIQRPQGQLGTKYEGQPLHNAPNKPHAADVSSTESAATEADPAEEEEATGRQLTQQNMKATLQQKASAIGMRVTVKVRTDPEGLVFQFYRRTG
jgi:hypothetical protein